jgi:UDP-galactopyranose mutase
MVPHIPSGLGQSSQDTIFKLLLSNFLADGQISDYVLWYYTPMALSFTRHLEPRLTVFDCMDELSAFKNAPEEMKGREAQLLERADIVFTGGQSLYEAKLGRHDCLHCFPSSIEFGHFARARTSANEPEDQVRIPHPRIGFAGVIDERMDLELLAGAAKLRPDLQFVMIGPVVKIDATVLPDMNNIHWLGGKQYKQLPDYMAGWDAAMLPFAHNESTRFISPTKTPEYLAAGKPVVSTSIADVVRPYGTEKLVRIADTPAEFVRAIDACIQVDAHSPEWRDRVDQMLAQNSWDLTCQQMRSAMENCLAKKEALLNVITRRAADLRPIAIGD